MVKDHTCECGKKHQCCEPTKNRNVNTNASAGAIYGIGLIGAVIYYVSTASGFWAGLIGVLKAIVWPAFVVFELMKHLQM